VLLELQFLQIKKTLLTALGSSLHRGNRAAGWFDDLIRDRANTNMKSVVLFEGINRWASAGKDYEKFMDGFIPQTWIK
jgi:arsenical-resistance protein 2